MSTESVKERKVPPGPGQYNLPSFPNLHPCSHVPISPKFSMPTRNKEPRARTDHVDPGKYVPKMEACYDRAPTWGFGTSKRLLSNPNDKNLTPGPQITQIDSMLFDRSPRFGFGSSSRDGGMGKAKNSPGPGGYNPSTEKTSGHKSAPSYSSGGAERMPQTLKSSNQPGPGGYTVMDSLRTTWQSSPRTRFGKSQKLAPIAHSTPGPGQYAISTILRTGDHSIIESAPKWSMGGRGGFELAKTSC